MAKPTLYARGGDKEELFALAVEAEVERLLERLDGARGRDSRGHWTSTSRATGSAAARHRAALASQRVRAVALARCRRGRDVAAALLGARLSALHGGPPVVSGRPALPVALTTKARRPASGPPELRRPSSPGTPDFDSGRVPPGARRP